MTNEWRKSRDIATVMFQLSSFNSQLFSSINIFKNRKKLVNFTQLTGDRAAPPQSRHSFWIWRLVQRSLYAYHPSSWIHPFPYPSTINFRLWLWKIWKKKKKNPSFFFFFFNSTQGQLDKQFSIYKLLLSFFSFSFNFNFHFNILIRFKWTNEYVTEHRNLNYCYVKQKNFLMSMAWCVCCEYSPYFLYAPRF